MEKEKIIFLSNRKYNSNSLAQILQSEGFTTMNVSNIDKLPDISLKEKPRAIFIDADIYGDKSFEFCKKLKENFETRKAAIILYSSEDNENDIVKGLEIGADDFVTNRYNSRELAARLKSIIRRIETTSNNKIKVKDIEIDLDEHKVKKSGKSIDLTYIQFKLLYLLASRRDNVFSRKEIFEKVWGRKAYFTNRTIDVHIKRLREKLGEYKYPSQYIETVHGTGYKFM